MPPLNLTAPPHACLFDLDGLLLDTEPLHARAWHRAAAHFGTDLTLEQLICLQGRRRHENAQLVCSWLNRAVTPEQLLTVRQPIADQLLPLAQAMNGAESLVCMAHRLHIATALVTSSDRASVCRKIGNHPWMNRLEIMVCGDDQQLKAGKPAPDPFQLGAERLGVSPAQCWAFEDSEAGCQSALEAGCLVWRLQPEGSRIQPHQPRWEAKNAERLITISDLSEAKRCLETVVSTDG